MHSLSPLQTLPLHIIELVVGHVAGSSRLYFDGVLEGFDTHAQLLLPLLDVSPNFRAAVVSRLCKVYELQLSGSWAKELDMQPRLPACLKGMELGIHLVAQKLKINVSDMDVYRGHALKRLARNHDSSWALPKVRSLEFTIFPPSPLPSSVGSAVAPREVEANIGAFVRRVKQMAPNAKKVHISINYVTAEVPQFLARHLTSLVAQLSQLAVAKEFYYCHRPRCIDPQLTGICGLLDFSVVKSARGELTMQLAQRNALTLQTLKLTMRGFADMSILLRNADGSYVQYPCLHTLAFRDSSDSAISQRPSFPGAVPFPSLRHLRIRSESFFGDDTPFRGNATTLEFLDLTLTADAISVLNRCKVFTPTSHPSLQYVSISERLDAALDPFETDVAYIRFALSIGPNAPVREVDAELRGPGVQSAISAFGECSSIQVLVFPNASLKLRDVIALIKALPLLSDLHTLPPTLGGWPGAISEEKLPAYVAAKYFPTGKRFRCWHLYIGSADFKEAVQVVECVFLLALACPNFDYAAVSTTYRELLMAHMNNTIDTNRFRPHKTRLRRLLFGEPRCKIRNAKFVRKRRAGC
ncbi:hypothetical protein GGI00_003121 [Coemansia sp. RSA 2681]|nr:hypothetical protein GGI00_003121 [Coemansia sp. RSA 2681]